jgi:hypothetical protein
VSTRAREEALGSLARFRGLPTQVAGLYEERARAIRVAFNAGASITAIAERLGIARKVVYDALRSQEEASHGSTR